MRDEGGASAPNDQTTTGGAAERIEPGHGQRALFIGLVEHREIHRFEQLGIGRRVMCAALAVEAADDTGDMTERRNLAQRPQ